MGTTAIDPALLSYRQGDWSDQKHECYTRIEQLLLHRRFVREFGDRFAMSSRLAAWIMECFPWGDAARDIPELRDLRQFFIDDLSRLEMIDGGESCAAELSAAARVAHGVDDPAALDAWEKLLAGMARLSPNLPASRRIATWRRAGEEPPPAEADLTLICDNGANEYTVVMRLIWDESSWYANLNADDWWPDLPRCVSLLFATNPALRAAATRQSPLTLRPTTVFTKSVAHHCQNPGLRRSLVESITKLIYGIKDKGLGDEAFKGMRRFRVTRFWRVHYRPEGDTLALLEFGPHDIGM